MLNKTQICSTPMTNLQLISTFQHQLTNVNAGTHSTSHLLRIGTEIYTHLSIKSLANSKTMKRILTTITMSLAIYSMQAQTRYYTADRGNGYAKLRIQSDGDGTNNNNIITMTAYGYGGASDLIVKNGNWGGGYYFQRGADGGTFNQVRIRHGGGGGKGYQTGYGILDIYGSGGVVSTSISGGGNSYFLNGNIGIGTANPGIWKLAVNGDIRAKKIKVEAGWSDFVFYKDYELPSLLEVENFIKENGHLKDIPSAMEVEKNGIFLGEMSSKLLQKIEELTLYTIEQEKKIEQVEKENESLKSLATKVLELQKRLDKLEKE